MSDNCSPCPYYHSDFEALTGPLPPDLRAATSYALYCTGTLFVVRIWLDTFPAEPFPEAILGKLEEAARNGKSVTMPWASRLNQLHEQAPFSDPRSRHGNAHLAALDLATDAVLFLTRPDLAHRRPELGLDCADYYRFERAIVWEAGKFSVAPPPADREDRQDAVEQGVVIGKYLQLIPGGFVYHGQVFPLRGLPWRVLHALGTSRWKRQTAYDLKEAVWDEARTSNDTVRAAVRTARVAVQGAMRVVGVHGPDDPIPDVDKGPNLAWILLDPP